MLTFLVIRSVVSEILGGSNHPPQILVHSQKKQMLLTFKYVRLRLGSHYMPIETGRWQRIPCHDRKCAPCNSLGDERHYIYDCPEIERNDIEDIPDLQDLANYSNIQLLMINSDKYFT